MSGLVLAVVLHKLLVLLLAQLGSQGILSLVECLVIGGEVEA